MKTQSQHQHLIHRGISAVFIGALLALAQAEAAFTLKTNCEVSGDGVYLSDLVASKTGEPIPAIMIDVSPSWGTIREYSSQDLIKLINERAQGVEVVSDEADIKTSISRSSRAFGFRASLSLLGSLVSLPLAWDGKRTHAKLNVRAVGKIIPKV